MRRETILLWTKVCLFSALHLTVALASMRAVAHMEGRYMWADVPMQFLNSDAPYHVCLLFLFAPFLIPGLNSGLVVRGLCRLHRKLPWQGFSAKRFLRDFLETLPATAVFIIFSMYTLWRYNWDPLSTMDQDAYGGLKMDAVIASYPPPLNFFLRVFISGLMNNLGALFVLLHCWLYGAFLTLLLKASGRGLWRLKVKVVGNSTSPLHAEVGSDAV